jgi:ubiquinone/menaquinone biosynthesis C-methylase UbiE
MSNRYRSFYEQVGACYPEDEITYSTQSGILRQKWTKAKLSGFPPGTLLDCGCNTGRLSSSWKKGPVYGVDISFSVLEKGKKRYSWINFINADICDLAFIRSNTIDIALCCEVLEHLEHPTDFLRELRRVLKRHGIGLITVPYYTLTKPQHVSLGIMRSYGVLQGTHGNTIWHTAYKIDELVALIEHAGFHVVETGSFERELRAWRKPLTSIEHVFDRLSERYFPSSKLARLFNRSIDRIEIALFDILNTLFVTALIRRTFKYGRRIYAVIKK